MSELSLVICEHLADAQRSGCNYILSLRPTDTQSSVLCKVVLLPNLRVVHRRALSVPPESFSSSRLFSVVILTHIVVISVLALSVFAL